MLKNNERLDDLQFNNLFIIQNPDLYCFTSDAVELCNFVKAGVKDRIVDLCSGSGVIGILAQAKTKAKHVVLVEIQPELADMSKRSVEFNKLQNVVEVVNAPLQNIHKQIGTGFEVVVCNPPYKLNCGGKLSQKPEIAICKHEIMVNLEEIVCESAKLLKFGGRFYTVNKEERLCDLFCLMRKYGIEPKVLKIKHSKGANIIFVEGKKGGKSGLEIQC